MEKSTKAALLSALVFPGTGYFYLKKIAGTFYSAFQPPLYIKCSITRHFFRDNFEFAKEQKCSFLGSDVWSFSRAKQSGISQLTTPSTWFTFPV
jgi:hypothetical protein